MSLVVQALRDYWSDAVIIIAKFVYMETDSGYSLLRVIVACVPSGDLQDRYNPTADETIWRVGRDAPTLGEDFRVRLNYEALRRKADWRVQTISGVPPRPDQPKRPS